MLWNRHPARIRTKPSRFIIHEDFGHIAMVPCVLIVPRLANDTISILPLRAIKMRGRNRRTAPMFPIQLLQSSNLFVTAGRRACGKRNLRTLRQNFTIPSQLVHTDAVHFGLIRDFDELHHLSTVVAELRYLSHELLPISSAWHRVVTISENNRLRTHAAFPCQLHHAVVCIPRPWLNLEGPIRRRPNHQQYANVIASVLRQPVQITDESRFINLCGPHGIHVCRTDSRINSIVISKHPRFKSRKPFRYAVTRFWERCW